MPTHLAAVSFDFDALSLWIQRGMKTPTPISRGEFGAVAVPRILKRWTATTSRQASSCRA